MLYYVFQITVSMITYYMNPAQGSRLTVTTGKYVSLDMVIILIIIIL